MKKILILVLGLIFIVGCTTINHSHIPFCIDVNETGLACKSPDNNDYNWNESICKEYDFYGTDRRLKFCNDTIERHNIRHEEEKENFICIKDYDNLNYTTLGISREDFENLECYRQIAWLNGVCYPSDCNMPNPPVCTSIYAVYCYNPDSPENK